MDPKEKSQSKKPEDSKEEEMENKGFFEIDEVDDWEEDLEDDEVEEKIREHKLKSMREKRKTGNKGEGFKRKK